MERKQLDIKYILRSTNNMKIELDGKVIKIDVNSPEDYIVLHIAVRKKDIKVETMTDIYGKMVKVICQNKEYSTN